MELQISWRAKLSDSKDLPSVEPITGNMSTRLGTGTVVIPSQIEVDELMKRVRKGRLTTVSDIRAALARKHGASLCCPITTGPFTLIAARAAAENQAEGTKRITPYWRTLKAQGEVNPKYPGGADAQRILLEAEGHTVIARGERLFVQKYESQLARF